MGVLIGQASIDERGKITGGKAGNQGNELNVKPWYKNGWTMVLRFKDRAKAIKAVSYCKAYIMSGKIGYDQSQRNTARNSLKPVSFDINRLTDPAETDCSAFMALCAEAAGVDMSRTYAAGNAPATFQMRAAWGATGEFEILTDPKYLNSDKYLLQGDVIVNEARHTCMALTDGDEWEEESEMVEKSYMIVNGKKVPVERILKNGTNYVKIRDVASALNLEVGYNGSIATLDSKN